ncbi:hypothetical protein JVT61DRAFT_4279 [Boletus reticuloceps]|uniref:Uncharacterized protein n=1 Tax=Boletus reticuloceps TaxID=495285 RepID=A0A8I2YM21_9AGAM|nr:hypothetical protein JVT61DRAFT_4279 [Boletus reticuloceps]
MDSPTTRHVNQKTTRLIYGDVVTRTLRPQSLDLHFNQWDRDKYLELSKSASRCSLTIIYKYSAELAAFKSATGFSDADFEKWHEEEKDYLRNCASERHETSLAVEYVELLQKLQFAEYVSVSNCCHTMLTHYCCFRVTYASTTSTPFLIYTPAQYTPTSGLNVAAHQGTNAVTAEHTSTLRRCHIQLNAVEHFEKVNGIHE